MIKAIFVLMCIGQLYACRKSYQMMILYYFFISAFSYFTIPLLGNFDTARICGLLVIWQSYVRYKWVFRNFFDSYFMLYVFYVFAVMIFMSFFWPLEFFFGSPIHREFRIFVQMITWGINVTLAVIISWMFLSEEKTSFFIEGCKYIALFHCVYGIYQYFAFKNNWPMTGIIRNNTVDKGLEELAVVNIGGELIYRVNSFVGEPKTLAALLVMLMAFIMSKYLAGKTKLDMMTMIICFLMLICYYMTFSTSAYFTMLGLVVLFLLCKDISEFRIIFVLIGAAAIFYFIWGDSLDEIMTVRLIERMEDEHDPPVTETMNYLLENPRFLIAGLGSGGISFYLAEILGGIARMKTFTPNVGIVYMLSESGIIGLVLLITPYLSTWWKLVTKQLKNEHFRMVAFLSIVFMMQLFLRAGIYTMPFIYGCLIAVSRMRTYFLKHSIEE